MRAAPFSVSSSRNGRFEKIGTLSSPNASFTLKLPRVGKMTLPKVCPSVSSGGGVLRLDSRRHSPPSTKWIDPPGSSKPGPWPDRSEERRGGKEGVSQGRYSGAPHHKKK